MHSLLTPASIASACLAFTALLTGTLIVGRRKRAFPRYMCPAIVGFVASLATVPSVTQAQHFDIGVFQQSGGIQLGGYDFFGMPSLRPDFRVFSESMGTDFRPGVALTTNPGWNAPASASPFPPSASALPGSTPIAAHFHADSVTGRNLSYWDGTGQATFGPVPDGEVLQYFRGSGFTSVADGGLDDSPSVLIGSTSPSGSLHIHPTFALYGNNLLDFNDALDPPTPGAYLTSLRVEMEGLMGPSDPVWAIFGVGMSDQQLTDASNWVESHVVPEPSTLTLAVTLMIGGISIRRRPSY